MFGNFKFNKRPLRWTLDEDMDVSLAEETLAFNFDASPVLYRANAELRLAHHIDGEDMVALAVAQGYAYDLISVDSPESMPAFGYEFEVTSKTGGAYDPDDFPPSPPGNDPEVLYDVVTVSRTVSNPFPYLEPDDQPIINNVYSPPVPWADDPGEDVDDNDYGVGLHVLARNYPELNPYWPDVPPMYPGRYRLVEDDTETVLAFEIRDFRITNLGFSAASVEISSGSVEVTGDITVYPNLTDNGLDGWKPSAKIDYRIRLSHPDLDPEDWIEEDFEIPLVSIDDPDERGVVASFAETIDLTQIIDAFDNLSQPLPSWLTLQAWAIVDVEDGENTISPRTKVFVVDDDRDKKKKPCVPPGSCNTHGLPNLSGSAHPDGVDTALTMTGANYDAAAGSMGFGWQVSAYKKVAVDGDGILTYHDGTGMIERWMPDGDNYIAIHRDNYTKAQKNEDDTFTLTFRDMSVMDFDDQNRVSKWTDTNGNEVSYTYEAGPGGRLTKVEDGFGRESNFSYDGASLQPESITSHAGVTGARTTYFTYHTSGQLESVTTAGETTSYAYTLEGRIESVTDPIGVAHFYTYFPDGRVETDTIYGEMTRTYEYIDEDNMMVITESVLSGPSAGDRVTEYHYDSYRNVVKIVDAIGNETIRVFGDPHNPHLLTRVLTENGADTKYQYNSRGNLVSTTDTYGYTTSLAYERSDFPDLVTSVTRPAGGGTTRMDYDEFGNLVEVEDATGKSTFMEYDSDGNLLAVVDRNNKRSEYTYDYTPKALKEIKTPKEGGGFRVLTLEYDGFDNVTRAVDELSQEIVNTYDEMNRPISVVDARANETEMTIVDGLLTSILSPPNTASGASMRETVMTYDSSGRLEEIIREISSGSQSRVKYGYDGFSQLRSLTRKKFSGTPLPHEFLYDDLGRPISSKDTLDRESTMAYAPFCVTRASTSARGIRTVSNFDLLCRPTSVQTGTPATEDLELDEVTETRSFEYDPLGRMISSTHPRTVFGGMAKYGSAIYGVSTHNSDGMTRRYTYNVLDRLTSVTFEDGKTAAFEYDFVGNLTKMTDPDGKVTLYEYHDNNSLAKVRIEREETVVGEFIYAYDEIGLPLSITYPDSTDIVAEFKSDTDERGWNANGQLMHLRYLTDGGTTLLRGFEFDYDPAGNRILQIDTSPGGTVYWKYSYDYLDRLVKVEKGTSDLDLLEVSLYTYDESDNRTLFELPQDVIKYVYAYDDADAPETIEKRDSSTNGLIFTELFDSDDDGNLLTRYNDLSDVTITYSWDSFDKLIAVSSAMNGTPTNDAKQQNSYNANGFRRKKKAKSGVVTTEYSDGLATAVAKGGGHVVSYIWGEDDELLGYEEDGQFRFFLTDALGTVRDVVNEVGEVIQSYEVNEFGISMPGSGSGTETYSPKTWVGAFSVNDDTMDSGLFMMGLRHYAPELGRFLSRDPLGFGGSLNPYVYAENSPLDLIDPEGLKGRGARARARAAQRAATRRFNRARRRQLHANLDALGLKNLDLSGKTLTRGANALYRRGFVFEGAELSGGRPCPEDWVHGSSVYYHFRNPTTGVKVIWDSGNMGGMYPNTQRPHWTIRKGNAYYNHRGESVPQYSGPAHIRSGGYGDQFYEVREQGVLPKGFPEPPIGNDGFIEIGPAEGPIEI